MPVESDADLLGMFDAEEFGVAATWYPEPSRPLPPGGVPVTVIRDDPTGDAAFGGVGGTTSARVEVMLPIAALPADPQRGDTLAIGAETFTIEVPRSDIDRALWRLTLSEA